MLGCKQRKKRLLKPRISVRKAAPPSDVKPSFFFPFMPRPFFQAILAMITSAIYQKFPLLCKKKKSCWGILDLLRGHKKGHLACMNIKGRCQLPKKAVLLTYSRVCISIKSLDSIPSKFANWQTSEFPKDMIAPQLRLLGPKQVGKRDFYLLFWSAMYFRLVHYTLSSEERRDSSSFAAWLLASQKHTPSEHKGPFRTLV